MDSDTAIKASHLTKAYKLYDHPKDRFKETFHPFRKQYHRDFYALHDLSFEIKKGDTVGIIGKNGSGKTTLLQIIYNVLSPTSGKVDVNGKTSALLELGAGFNPEFSGIDNVYFNGTIMGYAKEEMDEMIDDILSFADIGEFVHQPVKTYSTGMFVRLAFSVATVMEPDILIIDEALSVGDMFFQAKCINKIRKMIDNKNVTLLYVSHDLMSVKSICRKALFLDNGKMVDYGVCDDVVEQFFSMKIEKDQTVLKTEPGKSINSTKTGDQYLKDKKKKAFEDNALFLQKAAYQRIQNGKASIVNVQLLNENDEYVHTIEYEQRLIIRMAVEIHEDIFTLVHGYAIRNEDGVDVIFADSVEDNKNLDNVKKGEQYIIDWSFNASLTNLRGNYTIATVLLIPINYDEPLVDICDRVLISAQFAMQRRKWFPLFGLVHWDNKVDIIKC